MLSFDEIDTIITLNLDTLNPSIYQVIRESRSESILYTVIKSGELLGRYRVTKQHNGSVNYGPIQGDGAEWDLVSESMLQRTIVRAEGTMTEILEQAYQQRQNAYLERIRENKANETDQTAQADLTVKPEKPQDVIVGNYDDVIIRFGTDKNLSLSDVKEIVKRCNAFVKSGGKITEFHRQHSQDKYELETLRKWLKDPRFTD